MEEHTSILKAFELIESDLRKDLSSLGGVS